MSAEPIDIVVTDKVSTSAQNKFLNIASAALEAATNVDKVNAALKSLSATPLAQLAAAQERVAGSAAKANAAYLSQETALNKAIRAESLAGLASEKLAAAQAKTATANSAASTSADKAAISELQLANAVTKAYTVETQAVIATEKLAAAQSNASAAAQKAAQAATDNASAQARLTAAQAAAATAQARTGTATTASATALVRLGQAQTNAATATTRASTATTQAAQAQQRLVTATAQAEAAQSRAALAALRLQQAQDRASSGTNYFADGLGRFALRAAAAAAAYFTLQQFIEKTDAYTNLQNKLNQVAVSQKEVNVLTLELLDIANRSRAPLEAVGTTFQRIQSAIKAVGGSQKEALQITEALTKATAAAGLTAGEQASALLQVSQAFNKGKLDGDEFRSVMENFPQFADAIAKSLGLANKGLLFQAAKEGKINLDVMRDAMLKLGDAADNQLARSTITVDQSFTRLTNSTTVLLGELNKSLGVTSLLAKGLNYLADAAARAAKANAPEGSALANNLLQSNLDAVNNQIAAKQKEIELGTAGAAGQTKLNNLLKIQANIQAQISDNASSSRVSVRAMDNAAAIEAQNATEGKFAQSLALVTAEMDKVKVGTNKADQEIAKYRKGLDDLKTSSAALGDTKSLDAYNKALSQQARVEAEIRKANQNGTDRAAAALQERRADIINKTTNELEKQLGVFGETAEVRSANSKLEQIDIDLIAKRMAALTNAERAEIKGKLDIIEINKRVQAAQDSIYKNAIGPAQAYKDGVEALNILEYKNLLTKKQVAEAQKALDFAYQSSIDPLFSFNQSLKDQNDLLDANLNIQQRAARGAVQQINQSLAPQGKKLDEGQAAFVERESIALAKRNDLQAAYDQIVSETVEAERKLAVQQEATNKARDAGTISADDYLNRMVQIKVAAADLNLSRGIGTFEDSVTASLGRMLEGYKGLAAGSTAAFGDFFSKFEDGFANSVGRAIVYSEDLGSALKDVAKSALSELIGALVKLGIQYVVNAALGQSVAATTTATSAALAASTATAWAPAAALVSAATFGANALPASEGLLATYAVSEVIAALGGFQVGGYTGDGGSGQVVGAVHANEFVANEQATNNNRGVLEAMNRGAKIGTGGGGSQVNVSIQNYGTSKDFTVERLSETEIRVIARDEAKAAVASEAPRAVASTMSDPNSHMSKAVARNTTAQRQR